MHGLLSILLVHGAFCPLDSQGCQVCRNKVNDTKGLWRHSVRISRVNVLVSLHTQSFVRLIYFLYESRSISDFIFLYFLITYTPCFRAFKHSKRIGPQRGNDRLALDKNL
jgi:hypothetical protein